MVSTIKYSLLLFIITITHFCCTVDPLDGFTINCSFENNGTKTIIGDTGEIFQVFVPNIVSPDGNSVDQLVIGLMLIDFDLEEYIPFELIEYSCHIFNDDNELIFKTNSVDAVIGGDKECEPFHLWDLNKDSNPFYGFLTLNLEMIFDQNRSVVVNDYLILSVSCEQLISCKNFPEQCNLGNCRSGESYRSSTCGLCNTTLGLINDCE